ncbi:MAG: hypothetical protein L0Y71_10585 [Gemmataceae bacterium]|nr:hypothetical protein [Gemmataceae bacterium]
MATTVANPCRQTSERLECALVVARPGATNAPQPVTVGIPFAKGALPAAGAVALTDGEEQQIPVQYAPLARWSDGSVQWLLLDFVLPAQPGPTLTLQRVQPDSNGIAARGVRVHELPGRIMIDTGVAAFEVDPKSLFPIKQVKTNGHEALDSVQSRVLLTDPEEREETGIVESCTVEARGPVRATICLKGVFQGGVPARFASRLSFYAGTGLVRCALTLHNPQRARHRGGLWDLGDPGSMLFRDLSMDLTLRGTDRPRVSWCAEPKGPVHANAAGPVEIYQDSSGGENWQSRNHVNRAGQTPCTFRGYRARCGDGEHHGLRANPTLRIENAAVAVDVAVPEFWQNFPKALEAAGHAVRVRLFPKQFADLFELQGGEQKTHVVWLQFEAPGGPGLDWVHEPACVQATPEWYAASEAIPYLLPASDDPDDRFQKLMSGAIEGPNSFFAKREVIDEYGWRNYGDMYADHEAAYYQGPAPVISHYNNQYDVIYGTLLQFYRTADARWLELHDALARHVIDIDIYHTDRDKAAYNGGLFWHTDHYRDAATASHRAYSRVNQAPGKSYGGGPCNEHNYTNGLLHHYYLTGNPAARDAVLSLADWVVGMDDGRRTIFGLVDDGATGIASSTAERDYHGPGRGCGNSINALVDGWLIAHDDTYLCKADELIRRAIHPHDDIAKRDLLNSELRWSYTVFLTALARFLAMKAQAGQLDQMYAYARASLLHYAAWMADHEATYFTHPEKLEFPTETWAAQDFRKANVLRLASQWCDEPLRGKLLVKVDELMDQAWRDLDRFPKAATTRALAIAFTESVKDSYFRQLDLPRLPDGPALTDPGSPSRFWSQRSRVMAMIRNPKGIAVALVRMLNPRRWPRLR